MHEAWDAYVSAAAAGAGSPARPGLAVPTHPPTHPPAHPHLQVEFLPQCHKVAIMDEGTCVYFGPWNAEAQQLLGKYLPASHLLAAAGNAEQPREQKKKAEKKEEKSTATVSVDAGMECGSGAARGLSTCRAIIGACNARPQAQSAAQTLPAPSPQVAATKNKVHSASVPLTAAIW